MQRDSNVTVAQVEDLNVIERNARMLQKTCQRPARYRQDGSRQDEPSLIRKPILASLVRLMAANFEAAAADRRQQLTVETPTSLPAVIDTEKIERVIMNLLSNALKFTPDGGAIRCQLKAAVRRPRLPSKIAVPACRRHA